MVFTSYDFLFFFLIVFISYWLARERRWQNAILLAASYVFYGYVHYWYAVLLAASTLADYFIARGMAAHPERKRGLLWLSLGLNLGVLALFKYHNFFTPGLIHVLDGLGWNIDPIFVRLLLPAGLSFYTLKKLGYVLDVSNGVLEPSPDLVSFGLYVAFFPQITAGPIDRPQKLLPQIESPRTWQAGYFYTAWPLLLMGLFKKIVIADTIRSIVDRVFSLNEPNLVLVIPAALGFTLQILADFSAYTDLARGFALLLGFETSENFKNPYLSLSPTEFWNRWHITLSAWLRDYIFFPLRRALMRSPRRYPDWLVQSVPPLATMLVSGIWHGAGWTFVAWGGMYGVLIVLYQAFGLRGEWRPVGIVRAFFAWMVMFSFIVFGWLLFRAPSLDWVAHTLFTNPFASTIDERTVALITLTMTLFYAAPLVLKLLLDRTLRQDSYGQALYYAAATLLIILYINSSSPDFIYFQF